MSGEDVPVDPRGSVLGKWFGSAESRRLVDELDAADKAAGIYRVSLDAAIEAAAKADHAEVGGAVPPWDECPERWRAGLRDKWRPIVTAAVMGGAQ